MDHIHFNPVKQGHAPTAAAWSHFAFHDAVTRSLYPPNRYLIESMGLL
jgi:hypothetical protein